MMNIKQYRKTEYDINEIFLNRWSPRAMSGEKIKKTDLMKLFEAARWAPSSYNNQHWRFVYALNGTEHWDKFFGLLGDFNKMWAKNAGALVLVISKKTFDHNGQHSRTHSFDAGAAWENFALQGSINGFVIHGMEGFDYDKAREILKIPDEYNIEMMIAVGKPGKKEDLPEMLREKDIPSDRKKLFETVFEGKFGGN
jgi:nitroreductase